MLNIIILSFFGIEGKGKIKLWIVMNLDVGIKVFGVKNKDRCLGIKWKKNYF